MSSRGRASVCASCEPICVLNFFGHMYSRNASARPVRTNETRTMMRMKVTVFLCGIEIDAEPTLVSEP